MILLTGVQLVKAVKKIKKLNVQPIYDCISENYELMMKHWNGELDESELFERLTPN
jgi:hypothetical protein